MLPEPTEEMKRAIRQQIQTLDALKWAYRKHHMGDDGIGAGELSDLLCDTLCNLMGADEFVAWSQRVANGGGGLYTNPNRLFVETSDA